MALVFLSYDRDDASTARSIAQALEKAGHAVWWDFHIHGGAEFNKEIEEALAAADAVVVLWSKFAVESPWVRDEAAAGRDTGRLVPVRLDDARPPLGFRQYQSINLSAWTGRGRPPLQDVLSAIERLPANGAQNAPPRPAGPAAARTCRIPSLPVILLLIVALAAIAALFWQPWRSKHQAPLVAVTPAANDMASSSLAADLLVKLGILQSAHADALQLAELDSRQTPDFIIKVSSGGSADRAGANLMLVDNRADTLLWSREFSGANGKQADLRQQMAYSAAQVLDCAVQALSSGDEDIQLPTLKLFLSGCADMANLLAQDPRVAVSIFSRVVERAPKFKEGWKRLLLAELRIIRPGFDTDRPIRQNLNRHIAEARRLDPDIAEAFVAEAFLQAPSPFAVWIKAIDRALAIDPDSPEILGYRAMVLTNVGLMQEALAASRRAVEANPLSPSARDVLITALLNADQTDAAWAELAKSEQLWPGATNVLQSRFAVEFRVGDPAKALQIMKSGQLGANYVSNAAHESYLQARIEPSPRNMERAIVEARSLQARDRTTAWVYARALAEFGRHEDLIDFLLRTDPRIPYSTTWVIFRPSFSALHGDRRFIEIAKRFGALDFWRDTGKWPDFCGRSDLPYDCKAEAAKLG